MPPGRGATEQDGRAPSAVVAPHRMPWKEFEMLNLISEFANTHTIQRDTDSADRLVARCNMRIGLWAGAQLGLPDESRAIYALGVMAAGMFGPGHDDVVDKLVFDFAEHDIPITRIQILARLAKDIASH
jgi:hypothetical protein